MIFLEAPNHCFSVLSGAAAAKHPVKPETTEEDKDTSASKRPRVLEEQTGNCTVPYLLEDGLPVFKVSENQNLDTSDTEGLTKVYQCEPALQGYVMADEIAQLGERLFFLKGMKSTYDPVSQTLSLDFTKCRSKGGERCQLPMVLGADFLKDKTPFTSNEGNCPSYSPKHICIDLKSGKASYTSRANEVRDFHLPPTDTPCKQLQAIYRLLLQRSLSEVVFSQLVLDQLQGTESNDNKKALLHEMASFDRLTTDDPDRLGFRLVISEQDDGVNLTLSELKPEVAQKVWGSYEPQQLLTRLSALMAAACPDFGISQKASGLVIPLSTHQLSARIQEKAVNTTGIAFLDKQGRILRSRFLLRSGHPWASPGGAAKARVNPLSSAVIEAHAESGILPANLSCWHPLDQEAEPVSLQRLLLPTPPLKMANLSKKAGSGGSTDGGIYHDSETGKDWHIKWYDDEERARNEVLATRLYRAAGVPAADRHLMSLDGRCCTVSELIAFDPESKAQKASEATVQAGFMADAWLANRDVANNDNLRFAGGRCYRVDCGGALRYRTLGAPKNEAFKDTVTELDTFFDSTINPSSCRLFANLSDHCKLAGASRVAAIPRSTIERLVSEYGPQDKEENQKLVDLLIARQQDIAKRFPKLRNSGNAVYVVEPGGYDASRGIKDEGYPVQEFDNSSWTWLDFQDIRDDKLGEVPLRLECSDIFTYLAFEQRRIEAALQTRFPGVTVSIPGANAHLLADDQQTGVIETPYGFKPGRQFGLIRLRAADPSQAEAICQWLKEKEVSSEGTGDSPDIQVSENPYCFFRRITASHESANTKKRYQPYPTKKPERSARPKKFRSTLAELNSLREKLAVAAVYRDQKKTVAPGVSKGTEPAKNSIDLENITMDNLIPLHTDAAGEGLYCDEQSGQWFRLKPVADEAAARNEVLMARLAAASGLQVPKTGLFRHKDSHWVISPWVEGLVTGPDSLAHLDKNGLARLFVTAAWLGNSNIIGHSFDHIGVDEHGCVHGVNWCGGGYFNPDRKRKRQDDNGEGGFFGTVFELDKIRDSTSGLPGATLFATLSDSDIAAVIPEFLASAAGQVQSLVSTCGPAPEGERRYLASTLLERLGYLAMRYPNNLPRITQAELQAVAINGLHGYQLPVPSPDIQGQRIVIGHQFNEEGEGETRISLKLSPEKTAWLAKELELGQSHHDLKERLKYFLQGNHFNDTVMTPALRLDILETASQVGQLKDKIERYQSARSQGLPSEIHMSNKGIDDDNRGLREAPYVTLVQNLSNWRSHLEAMASIKDGAAVKSKVKNLKADLPFFLPERVRSDWTAMQPKYKVRQGQWHPVRHECNPNCADQHKNTRPDLDYIPFAGYVTLHKVTLEPDRASSVIPVPDQKMTVEFHGPDTNAWSFEGTLRLVTKGQDEQAILRLLNWLGELGLDCSRPGVETLQADYEQHLEKRADTPYFPVPAKRPRWEKHTFRINGRVVQMLPEERRLPKATSKNFRPVHNLSFYRQHPDTLKKLACSSLTLKSFVDRINSGAVVDGINICGNITDGAANLLFTCLQQQNAIEENPHLVFKPWLLNRLDQLPANDANGMSQPWFQRSQVRLQEKMISRNQPECNFSGVISLPESLESITVETDAHREKVIQDLKEAGFEVWLDGRPVDELISVIKSLNHQYIYCLHRPFLSQWQKKVVENAGLGQFRQLLSVNPELQAGKLVSLEGITLSEIKLKELDLNNICLRNSDLRQVTFRDCKVANADLAALKLEEINWAFTDPDSHSGDIDYLSAQLENSVSERQSALVLEKLLELQMDTQRFPQALRLFLSYGDLLGETSARSFAWDLFNASKDNHQPLLKWFKARKDETGDALRLKLCCALSDKAADQAECSALLEQSKISTICDCLASADELPVRQLCFSHLRNRAFNDDDYNALATVEVRDTDFQELEAWAKKRPHPGLLPHLLSVVKLVQLSPKKSLDLFKSLFTKMPVTDRMKAVTLSEISNIPISIPLVSLFCPEDQQQERAKQLLDAIKKLKGDFSKNSRVLNTICHQASWLCPDKAEVYRESCKVTKQFNLTLYTNNQPMGTPATGRCYFQRGLNHFKNDPVTQRQLLDQYCSQASEQEELLHCLLLAPQCLDANEAWSLYTSLKGRLGNPCASKNKSVLDLFQQVISQWSDKPEFYIEFITLIQEGAIKPNSIQQVSAIVQTLKGCQHPDIQSKTPEMLASLYRPPLITYSELLSMLQKKSGSNEAWNLYQKINSKLQDLKILSINNNEEGKEANCCKFYQQALSLWPDNPEIYIDYITLIKRQKLSITKEQKKLRDKELMLDIGRQGLEHFRDMPDIQKRLLDHLYDKASVSQYPDILSLAHQSMSARAAEDLLLEMNSQLFDRLAGRLTTAEEEGLTKLRKTVLSFWPDNQFLLNSIEGLLTYHNIGFIVGD